jgi:uncharacterized Ntn-hydrolase superfamily protein
VLAQLRSGATAAAAIAAVLDGDTRVQYRQLAAVDATGLAAAHTGNRCIPESGNHLGAGYSTQANLMDRPTVWGAMGEAYESSGGDLTERLLAALEAAEREGGDIRGRQSAAIVVVERRPAVAPPLDRVFDLRVEDHTDPVGELRRLVTLRRAYILLNEGDQLVAKDDIDGAVAAYTAAAALLPDDAADGEPAFWTGVALAGSGQIESAADHLAKSQKSRTRSRWVMCESYERAQWIYQAPNHRAPSGPLVMASGRASAFPHRKRRDLARCGDPADGVSRVLSRWRTRTRIRSVHAD